jgi:SAM-dependent methyltransferase
MVSINELKIVWEEEYKRKGIPSSFRKDPSGTVMDFIQWLKKEKTNIGHNAADIGCGMGRNSFYLASQGFNVTGIDLLEANAKAVNAQAESDQFPIQAFVLDAATEWPIASDSLDIAIDVFCYKHIVNKKKQNKYRQELWRTLKAEGFYFISLASESDGFYGPLLKNSTNPSDKLIVDPYSNIPSFLYSKDDLIKEFSDLFDVVEVSEQTSTSPMYGNAYSRLVINAIFKKK